MRLLLDENVDRTIAEGLRKRGIDAVAVTEDVSLRGTSDRDLLQRAVQDRRTLVTHNVKDFPALINERVVAEQPHYGVIFLGRRSGRGKVSVGPTVEALEALATETLAADALIDREIWL